MDNLRADAGEWASKTYRVVDAKTGEFLGVIEQFRRDISPVGWTKMRQTRTWFRLQGREDINADSKGQIAAFLGGQRKTRIE
jgi:hypothetical protein